MLLRLQLCSMLHQHASYLDEHPEEGGSVLGVLMPAGDGQATYGRACGLRQQRQQCGGHPRPPQEGGEQGGSSRVGL